MKRELIACVVFASIFAGGTWLDAQAPKNGSIVSTGLPNGVNLSSTSDGTILMTNNAGTSFTGIQFGGTSAAFPYIQRNGNGLSLLSANSAVFVSMKLLTVQTATSGVAALPSCAAGTEGSHANVSDSNAASYTAAIGAVVVAGGSTHVPVFCDGTNWRIG